ncbi:MAG TPA: hypothetical protein VHY84_18520 [Bryobacteraceae bacterium]|jgi:hypothetical protein|nr:hypothetical protein [Bryobacteraceae bacterium]
MATTTAVKTRFTTEGDITAEVVRRFERTPDPRLRENHVEPDETYP